MKLQAFNKDKSLKQLKRKKNKDKYILMSTMCVCITVLIVAVMYFAFARYEVQKNFTLMNATVGDFQSGDFVIAAYVDGNKSKSIPQKDSGYYLQKVECENGATGTWDSSSWELTVANATSQTKCYVYFTTLIAQADTTGQYSTLSKYYPVGSVYQTTTSDNPTSLFGGCWSKIEGKFLLSSSSSYTLGSSGGNATNTLAASQIPTLTSISGSTGYMSANNTHNHTGTTGWQNQNATHHHSTTKDYGAGHNFMLTQEGSGGGWYVPGGGANPINYLVNLETGETSTDHTHNFTTSTVDINHTHSFTNGKYTNNSQQSVDNMPPYEVVNTWKRIECQE